MIYRVLIALLSMVAIPAYATDLTFPDRNRAAVVDAAHILSPQFVQDLNRKVVAWDKATGHQLAIVTVPSLQGQTVFDYSFNLARHWQLGRKGIDDGILFLIAPTERKIRIDVGRGLEGDLTDAQAILIIKNVVGPKLKAGDAEGGVRDGADAIMRAVPAEAGDLSNAPKDEGPSGTFWVVMFLLVAGGGIGIWFIYRRLSRPVKTSVYGSYTNRVYEGDLAPAGTPMVYPRVQNSTSYSTSTASYDYRSPPVIAPIIIEDSFNSSPSSYDDTPSSTDWGSSDSSGGFDSGGGDFGGGGADSDY